MIIFVFIIVDAMKLITIFVIRPGYLRYIIIHSVYENCFAADREDQ
jgi:hypothetical protein